MTLSIIKQIINNDDISYHIYNLYLIEKIINNNNLNINKKINLFLNYFKNKKDYWSIIFKYLNINKIEKSIKRLIINDEILKILINKNPDIIKILDNKYRNNEVIISKLCYHSSYYFKYASESLKNNINFILKLLEINIYIYFYIDDRIKYNIDIIKKIKKLNPFILVLLSN